jgi:hypothetical protein
MPSSRWPTRRLTLTAVGVIAALIAGALVVKAVWFRDQARVVAVDDAVDRFRDTLAAEPTVAVTAQKVTSTTVATEAAAIEPGVYRYRTTGSERVDALGGTVHQYPAETVLTVTASGCGVWLRWDLLEERREEWQLCTTADGVALQPVGSVYHEFYGVGEIEELRCDRAVVVVPQADSAPPVALQCMLADLPWLPVWEVLGRDTVVVDGSDVPAWHVRMTIDDNDEYPEQTTIDWWLAANGLPLRMTSTTSSTSDSDLVGDVRYEEEYAAELVSLDPLR